jgi:hypothetical protein
MDMLHVEEVGGYSVRYGVLGKLLRLVFGIWNHFLRI